ncbi:hypothetical protein [Photobacterium leiognathi]|uniref:hypothetical protein n=1 Tax=Photobacterium leiognathi TaxID=553611 RepID=UPI002982AC80|nr:hypothetical protein [Photobacterium leiognathi]
MAMAIAIFFSIYGLSGSTILYSSYGSGEINKSPMFEYSIIFFLIAMMMSNQEKKKKLIILLFLLFFSIKSFLYGGRIEVIQIALVYAYVERNLLLKENVFKIFIVLGMSFLIFKFVGELRTNPEMVRKIISLDFSDDIHYTNNNKILSTNASDVTQATTRMIGMVDDGEITLSYSIKSFFSYIFNLPLILNTELSSYQNLAAYKKNIYNSGGGGLIVGYFYVWMGIIGPIFIGLFIGCITRWLYQMNNIYLNIYSLFVMVSFPRWFAYGPVILVKFCLVGVIYVFIFNVIRNIGKK